jgi:hypothetical protein
MIEKAHHNKLVRQMSLKRLGRKRVVAAASLDAAFQAKVVQCSRHW